MATIYRIQRKEKYSDGLPYWNTLKSTRNREKAEKIAREISGHVRIVEEDDED